MSKISKVKKYVMLVNLCLIIGVFGVAVYWVNDTYEPDAAAQEAMISDDEVTIEDAKWITFDPAEKTNQGFIFYPGGLVEPEAYAPICRKIAEAGVKVIIVPMRMNLAVLSPDRAQEVLETYPEITDWTIGGHSLGGVMAANFAASEPEIDNVVLLASYPQKDVLKDSNQNVLSIYGSMDGVAKMDKVKHSNLGNHGELIEIRGGNHGGFGSYGLQSGDHEAEITNEEQISIAAEAVVKLIQEEN